MYQVSVFGAHGFDLIYDDSELKIIIGDYIENIKNSELPYFTYYTLCNKILEDAYANFQLAGREKNVFYENPTLSSKEYSRISRTLWNFIWDRLIFIDFSNNQYIAHFDNDTVFGVIKNK